MMFSDNIITMNNEQQINDWISKNLIIYDSAQQRQIDKFFEMLRETRGQDHREKFYITQDQKVLNLPNNVYIFVLNVTYCGGISQIGNCPFLARRNTAI